MHPNLSPTASSLFFVIITIISIFTIVIRPCFCQENNQYAACGQPFQCTNFQNMGYPFWGGNRPEYCGNSSFQLNCQGDVPLITIRSVSYRVLLLDEPSRSLTLARADMWNNSCPARLVNTTFDSTPFSSLPTNPSLAVYYGCTLIPEIPNQFNCTTNPQNVSYFRIDVGGPINSSDVPTCTNSIRVPVNATWGQALGPGAPVSNLEAALAGGFGVQWTTTNENSCNICKGSGGRCGSNAGSNSFACYCADGVFDTICNTTAGRYPIRSILEVIAYSMSGLASAISILVTIIYCCARRCKARKNEEMDDKNVEAFLRNHGSLAPKRYAYSDIKKMTKSFADKLGEGGYGSVFKGKLSNDRLVAVKVLSDANVDGGDFVNEVASISRTSHVNIVTLLGFCLERNKRALVYEFMPNKSLDKFISKDGPSSLDLETLYRIAVGTARGLEYLHRGCNTRIVHFDIKPENILLDEEFCPKISDFGLAKLCKRKNSIVSMMGARGTPGYIAPEVFCRNFGEVSHKSDVYSYGMMVINMVGAGENAEVGSGLDSTSETYFPDFIYKRLELGENLRGLQREISEVGEETTRKMVLVSLWCIQTHPLDRPSMSKVVEMLEGSIELIQIPPKPFLFSPVRATQDSCSALSSSYEIQID